MTTATATCHKPRRGRPRKVQVPQPVRPRGPVKYSTMQIMSEIGYRCAVPKVVNERRRQLGLPEQRLTIDANVNEIEILQRCKSRTEIIFIIDVLQRGGRVVNGDHWQHAISHDTLVRLKMGERVTVGVEHLWLDEYMPPARMQAVHQMGDAISAAEIEDGATYCAGWDFARDFEQALIHRGIASRVEWQGGSVSIRPFFVADWAYDSTETTS